MDYVQPYIGMLESCLNLEPGFIDLENISFLEDADYVYLLGNCFCSKDIDGIKKFSTSRLWFTYRKNFPAIGGTGPSSDQGWGCMLRCGQMLLAQSLTTLHLGRTWNWERGCKDQVYRRLLRMFQDKRTSLYSIHQIGQMGVAEGKPLGEWFGPNTIAQVLKKLVVYDDFSKLAVHVALDNILISSDVRVMATTKPPMSTLTSVGEENAATSESNDPVWRPLLIIIPLRLGLTVINNCYLPAIQEFFKLPQCAGIIGGRPNHAVYFFGNVGNKLIYLDPHVCQESINLEQEDPATSIEIVEDQQVACDIISDSDESPTTSTNKKNDDSADDSLVHTRSQSSEESYALSSTSSASGSKSVDDEFDDSSFHCPYLLHMDFTTLDPSLALAFICICEEDYNDLVLRLKPVLSSSNPPLFEILEERPKGWPKFVPYVVDGNALNDTLKEFDDFGDPTFDSDDNFEILE